MLVLHQVATSQWDLHRILAQVALALALVEFLPLALEAPAAFLLFPWDHPRIPTWPVLLVLGVQCHQDLLWEDQADQWEALVDQWEALAVQWAGLEDQWEDLEVQWEDLVVQWEGLEDQ